MKKSAVFIFSLGLLIAVSSIQMFAQRTSANRGVSSASNLYVISAKAGGVNFVEGTVNIARKKGRTGLLLKGDTVEVGDKISTAADGKAEILLNPGSFVRLAGNSEFEFTTTALEDLQLKLNSGSAMFEVITDNEFTFAVNTPKAKFFVVKTGVYRIDILADGASKIEVWKGKAQLDDAYQTEVKSGRQAVVNGNQATVAKFDRDEKDEFEVFSKARAKELAKVNKSLQNINVRNSLMSSYYQTRWSMYDSYGLWVFDRMFGSYAFLPFGYGWNSPYGYYYNCNIWNYNLPPVIYYPPIQNTPTNPSNPTNPTVVPPRVAGPGVRNPRGAGNSGGVRDGNDAPVRVMPPYMRVQKEIGSYPVMTDTDSSFPGVVSPPSVRGGSSGSVYVPSAPPASAPPPMVGSPSALPSKGN